MPVDSHTLRRRLSGPLPPRFTDRQHRFFENLHQIEDHFRHFEHVPIPCTFLLAWTAQESLPDSTLRECGLLSIMRLIVLPPSQYSHVPHFLSFANTVFVPINTSSFRKVLNPTLHDISFLKLPSKKQRSAYIVKRLSCPAGSYNRYGPIT